METITSRTNERVKQLALLCDSAAARTEAGLCVAHGVKLCREIVRLGGALTTLWCTDDAAEKYPDDYAFLASRAAQEIHMTASVCEKLTPQRSPQGILAVAALPAVDDIATADKRLAAVRRVLVLDSIQDPSNAGAMLRTAAALGYGAAVLSDSCADPFSPKGLRGSMGAAFAIPLFRGASGAAIARALQAAGFAVVATALDARAMPVTALPKSGALALVVGNEGGGLSDETIAACDHTAIIPITERAESLNAAAAAAIAMWELRP